MTGRVLLSLMIGVTGAVLLIAGIRDTHPGIVFQQLLTTGTLPATGARTVTPKTATPKVTGSGGSGPTKI